MPDSYVIPFLIGAAVLGWALACAMLLWARMWQGLWWKSQRHVSHLEKTLSRQTPHQKAAETKRRKAIAEARQHREAMQADIQRTRPSKLICKLETTPGVAE